MKEKLSAAGSVLAAVLASSCCWGPLLLAGLGAGGAGFATALAPWRPYLMAVTFVFLAAAWYFTLRKKPAAPAVARPSSGFAGDACCAREACCPPDGSRRRSILLLSAVTAFALAMLAFPQISTVLAESGRRAPERRVASGPVETASLAIKGMTCEACAGEIRQALLKLPGVASADVDYRTASARVSFEPRRVSGDQLKQAVAKTGYSVTSVTPATPAGSTTSPSAGARQ